MTRISPRKYPSGEVKVDLWVLWCLGRVTQCSLFEDMRSALRSAQRDFFGVLSLGHASLFYLAEILHRNTGVSLFFPRRGKFN